jgi:hypothetical protein
LGSALAAFEAGEASMATLAAAETFGGRDIVDVAALGLEVVVGVLSDLDRVAFEVVAGHRRAEISETCALVAAERWRGLWAFEDPSPGGPEGERDVLVVDTGRWPLLRYVGGVTPPG